MDAQHVNPAPAAPQSPHNPPGRAILPRHGRPGGNDASSNPQPGRRDEPTPDRPRHRETWLNSPEWCERVPEVVPLGMATSPYPDRIVAKPGFEAQLAKRTLTNLYNARPAWLAHAHEALDAAVAAAYGWVDYSPALTDDEVLRRLLALNLARAAGD